MGWWEIGGDETIGDGPVDAMLQALSQAARQREEQGRPHPTLAELLGGLLAALRRSASTSDWPGPSGQPRRLTARLEPAGRAPVRSDDGPVDDELTTLLRQGLVELRGEYRRDHGREPSAHEVLETVAFVLASDPDELLSGLDGATIVALGQE
jgi:hypothetical protein